MRVLMISKACVVGIYQRKLEEMARLPDIDLSVIVPPVWQDPSGPVRLERVHVKGYRLLVEPIRFNGSFHLYHFPTLRRRIRAFCPDIVHIDEEPYNFATWQALWLAKRVGARTLFFSWQNIRRRYPPPFSIGEAWALRAVDFAIMGTQSAAEVWHTKGYRGRQAVIPQFGVDPTIFHPQPLEPLVKPVIGYIGRLVPEKGVDLLIRALAKANIPGAHLRIIGQGPERARLEKLACTLNVSVEFMGQIPSVQMPAMYAGMAVVALPSRTLPNWKEQFGRVIVEAMASGVPVIGSDSGAIPDVIGDAGLVFREGDMDALARHITALSYDSALRAQLVERGRVRVTENYTHVKVAAQTVEVYRQMMHEADSTRVVV